jgi:hypothetical protein
MTISAQLEKLGCSQELIGKVAPYIRYCGDKDRNQVWDFTIITEIKQIMDCDKFVMMLLDQREWSSEGGGIEMSNRVVVMEGDKNFFSKGNVYRDRCDQRRDCWGAKWERIIGARDADDIYVVTVEQANHNTREVDIPKKTT